PNPTPAKECMVRPPMLTAAIPVGAVSAICETYGTGERRLETTHSPRRKDFPTPAEPVKKTFRPFLTRSRTSSCSSE
ncbi:hypothetical protein BT69DRAFT_1183897, partial [Atractiella rhizophila]